jgi:hypothetical protein
MSLGRETLVRAIKNLTRERKMSENPSTLTSIDAYDLFVDPQFLASHPKSSFTLASAKCLTSEEGVELPPTTDPTVVVFSEFDHPSVLAGPRRRPRTALWESGEHVLLGDNVSLPGIPKGTKFPIGGGISPTYGQVLALSGDFVGVPGAPICQGATEAERQQRFGEVFKEMYADPNEIGTILRMINEEVEALNKAIQRGDGKPSDVYKQFGIARELEFNRVTKGRYLNLAATNFDHFGDGAVAAYKACHAVALMRAEEAGKGALSQPGVPWKLEAAYFLNAFADHYLSDLFSAGHLRTDRVKLHIWSTVGVPGTEIMCGDYLAKFVHDEDSRYGLNVENERSNRWRAYGDNRYFDKENQKNRQLCEEAVQVSIQEIYQAYLTKNGAPVFGALKLIPNLTKARDWSTNPDNRVLFHFEGAKLLERKDVNNLGDHNYVECLTGPFTVADLKLRYKLLD